MQVNVVSRRCSSPVGKVVQLCKTAIATGVKGNLHFFVNSVSFIAQVIRKAGLNPHEVKVVCSQSRESAKKNAQKLGANYPIENPSDPVKKINFYTSTCFEGCDILDPLGKTYIVSNGAESHTLVDISTLFVQICGRIRNSAYKNEIVHIYSTTRYGNDVTLEQYTAITREILDEAVSLADEVNGMTPKNRAKMLSKTKSLNEQYVRIEDSRLIVDKNFANIDIVNFKICHQIYKTSILLNEEYMRNGLNVTVKTYQDTKLSPSEKLQYDPDAKISFRDIVDEYHELKTNTNLFSFNAPNPRIGIIELTHPIIKELYQKLGYNEIVKKNYNLGNLKTELVKNLDISTECKIVKMINERLQFHTTIPSATIKTTLQEIYDALGVKWKAKATDLAGRG